MVVNRTLAGADRPLPHQRTTRRGAFGAVYRAFDPTLDREVALKVPHAEFQRDAKAVERFLREAKAAARLHHPYIVTVFEAGTDGDTSYIASAFITGRSLAAAIDDGPLEPRRAARIVAALADALHAAHQQGIVHRDVKPANVLMDADDWPHLADFGLARLAAGGAKLTKVGSILGTPAYLAPELAQGKSDEALPASDQYSLGATLYELLCGEVPFAGPLEVVLFNTLNTPPPPLRDDHPQVPAELEAICLKSLSKKPEERYASCRELAKDLGKWLAGRPTSLGDPRNVSASRHGSGRGGRPGDRTAGPGDSIKGSRRSIPRMDTQKPNDHRAGCQRRCHISARWCVARNVTPKDKLFRKNVAYALSKADDQRRPATTIPAPIQPPESPTTSQTTEKATESKKAETSVASNSNETDARDRVNTAAKSAEKPTVAPSSASAKTQPKLDPALKLPYEERVRAAYEACLANQGQRARVLLASCPAELRGWEWYYCQRLSRGGITTISGQSKVVNAFEFSPDGKLIAFSGDLSVKIWDGRQVKKLGDHKDVVSLSFVGKGTRVISLGVDGMAKEWELASGSLARAFELPLPQLTCVEISGDSRWVAAGNRSGILKVWDAKSQQEVASRKLRQSGIIGIAFSADGTRIAAAVRDGVTIFDWRDEKTEPVFRKLASTSGLVIDPDGHQLAASAANSVWTWDLATKTKPRALAGHDGPVRSLVYSHDGKRLATGGADRNVQVWDATTGRLEASYQGHSKDVTCIRFSPDGQSIAASSLDGNLRVWKLRDGLSEKTLDFGPFKDTSAGNQRKLVFFG